MPVALQWSSLSMPRWSDVINVIAPGERCPIQVVINLGDFQFGFVEPFHRKAR